MPINALSFELLAKLVNSAASGIVVTDPMRAGNPIIFANDAFYKITGYSAYETIGHNCKFLQGADRAQPALEELRQAIKKRESCRVTLRNYKKDGTMFWNELYMTPHFDGDQLTHFVGVQNDVTAIVEQKHQKEMYNAGIIHDIKGPLFGQARILEYLAKQEPNAKSNEAYEMMLASLKSSLMLITDVLAQYKLENNFVTPAITKFATSPLIARVIENAQAEALARNVHLGVLSPGGETYITADQDMVLRALKNLVDNAIKNSAPGKNVWLLASSTVSTTILAVLDQGPGMPQALKEALIKDSTKIESAFTGTTRESTGLGLMTCAQIMRIHGGTLTLLKSDEDGTDLALIFPIQPRK